MNQKNNNKQKEDCPLCETAKEAVDMLGVNKDSEVKNKKSFRKIKMIFWCLVIIFGVVGGYEILSNSLLTNSLTKSNLIQEHVQVTHILDFSAPCLLLGPVF